jgi:hypothetical protein
MRVTGYAAGGSALGDQDSRLSHPIHGLTQQFVFRTSFSLKRRLPYALEPFGLYSQIGAFRCSAIFEMPMPVVHPAFPADFFAALVSDLH